MFSVLKLGRLVLLALTLGCASGFTECYKPVKGTGLPSRIRTIAVPAFENAAQPVPRFRVEQRFTEAVMNEIVRRGRNLRVQSEPEGADAVINGEIKRYDFSGVLLDNRGRARVFEVMITAGVTVRDQTQNRVLYDNQNYVFRGEFEFSSDPRTFFNEEDPAVQRIARKFAEDLVSTLINGFGVNEGR